ncbi:MAG: restriction endonuclease subunit S, partial [Syntrophomonadaceae bacterium]|nr:restriction endonuclease subunit S [Syntrophomonadaceae bacterium]
MSSSEWSKTNLGDICEIIGGGTPKTSVNKYWGGEIPWLSVVDFKSDNRYVHTTEKTITTVGLKNSSTKMLNKGDLIITARVNVGALAQLSKPMAFNQSYYGLRSNDKAVNDFLYYAIKNIIKEIRSKTHGSVFSTITRDTFNILEIFLPTLKEQKAIAATLSCLDDMIELNNRTNEVLEEMAQAIFKHWFVDFEFPHDIGEPFKASGGEMVGIELAEIPEGWKVGVLEDIGEIIGGSTPSKKNPDYYT